MPGAPRILLVVDDPWTRRGARAALVDEGGRHVEAATVEGALRTAAVETSDALVIDVRDRSGHDDRFRGVGLIRRLRAQDHDEGRCRPVVALTADRDLDLLAVRVAEAGADVLWRWDEVDVDDLVAAAAPTTVRAPLDTVALKDRAGLAPSGRVNDFVDELVRQGIVAAFRPGTTQQGSGVPRRRSMALRRLAGELGGLRPETNAGATPLQTPSWREVRRFVQRAVGLEEDAEALTAV